MKTNRILKTTKLVIAGIFASVASVASAGPVDDFQDFVLNTVDRAELHGVWSTTTDGRQGFGAGTLFKIKKLTVKDTVDLDFGLAYVVANMEDDVDVTKRVARRKWLTVNEGEYSVRSIAQIGCAVSLTPKQEEIPSNLSTLPIIRNLNLDFSLSKVYVGAGSFVDELEPVFSVGIGGISFGN